MGARNKHRIINGVEEKYCCKCDTWKSLDNFGAEIRLWDGLAFYCKECVGKRQKQHYRDNPEKRRVVVKRYYKNNLEKCKKATNYMG